MALDIIFISFDEPNADYNFSNLQKRFPYIKRVCGISGIHNAHLAASKLSDTQLFYVVDGDTEVFDSFDFSFKPNIHDQEYVHIWKSRNPVNGLEYGYGGVKLFAKKFFKSINMSSIDFSTSLTTNVKYVDEVVSFTRFNSDEFRAWRGAFRECAKLSSKAILGQIDVETEYRLNAWLNIADKNEFFSSYVLEGAKQGNIFGLTNVNQLHLLNDFNWLKQKFEEFQ